MRPVRTSDLSTRVEDSASRLSQLLDRRLLGNYVETGIWETAPPLRYVNQTLDQKPGTGMGDG